MVLFRQPFLEKRFTSSAVQYFVNLYFPLVHRRNVAPIELGFPAARPVKGHVGLLRPRPPQMVNELTIRILLELDSLCSSRFCVGEQGSCDNNHHMLCSLGVLKTSYMSRANNTTIKMSNYTIGRRLEVEY